MKLVSVWRDGQWAQAPRSPRVLGLPPALSSLLPPSLLARGYLWSLLGGAFGPAGWLQRKHSIGAHILAQASQSCLASLCPRSVPAALLYSPLKGHSGTGNSDFISGGAEAEDGRAPSPQKLAAIQVRFCPHPRACGAGRGVEFPGTRLF